MKTVDTNLSEINYWDGSKRYYLYEKVISDEFSVTKINGRLHRLDGPAVEFCNGKKEYWILGKKYSYSRYKRVVKLMTFT